MIRQRDEEAGEKKEEEIVSKLLCKKIKPCELWLGREGRQKSIKIAGMRGLHLYFPVKSVELASN